VLAGGHLLLRRLGSYGIIFMNACYYNYCHGNAVEGSRTLCLLSVCRVVHDHLLLKNFES
jgi:hypothetical protein